MRSAFKALPLALAATLVPALAQDNKLFGALPCTYTVTPASVILPAMSTSFTLTITASRTSGCYWAAVPSADWLIPVGGQLGQGSGTVSYRVDTNPDRLRTATIQVAGYTVTVVQIKNSLGGSTFYPLAPCRLVDTRADGGITGGLGPPFLKAGAMREFHIPPDACGIPFGFAFAFSFNVTAAPHGPLRFLSVWPAAWPWPGTSTLTSPDGAVVANAAIVHSADTNSFAVMASDDTDVIIDVNGFFALPEPPGMLAFYPIAPCHVVDTRTYSGKRGVFGPPAMSSFETRSFPIQSGCSSSIPVSEAQAYSVNITAWPHGPLGYLSTWATGQPQPFVSTLNSYDGRVVANAAIVPAGAAGSIDVFATDPTDVIIDVNGYFAPPVKPGAMFYFPVVPCRVADTHSSSGKSGPLGPPAMHAFESRIFPIRSGGCPIIPSAQAYALNITAWPEQPLPSLTAWPAGVAAPSVSALSSFNGSAVANAAIVQAGLGGAITLFVTGTTDVFLDLQGYFAP